MKKSFEDYKKVIKSELDKVPKGNYKYEKTDTFDEAKNARKHHAEEAKKHTLDAVKDYPENAQEIKKIFDSRSYSLRKFSEFEETYEEIKEIFETSGLKKRDKKFEEKKEERIEKQQYGKKIESGMNEYSELKYINLNSKTAKDEINNKYSDLFTELTEKDAKIKIDVYSQINDIKCLLQNLRENVQKAHNEINKEIKKSETIKKQDAINKLQGLYQHISPDQIMRENEMRERHYESPNYKIRLPESLSGVLAVAYKQAENDFFMAGIMRPCNYSVIGLGSMALQQATPYSDLEFAIIVENNEKVSYFQNLTHLVHFRIIQLGETVCEYNKSYNKKKGVRFDSWDKTPFGKEGKYELINTIDGFKEYLSNKNNETQKKDPLLHSMLETTCFVYGNENLFNKYKEMSHKILKSTYKDRFSKMFLEDRTEAEDYSMSDNPAKKNATKALLHQYNESLGKIKDFLKFYQYEIDVKQDIYRPVDRAIYTYSAKHGWFQESIFQLLHRLHDGVNKNTIDLNTKEYLSDMVFFALKLKLLQHESFF
jgi:hypothetical protein